MRDLPTRRNLNAELSGSGDARTGESHIHVDAEVNSPGKSRSRLGAEQRRDLRDSLEQRRENDMRHKLMEQRHRGGLGEERSSAVDGRGKGKEKEYDGRFHGGFERGAWSGDGDRMDIHGRRRGTYRRKLRVDLDRRSSYEPHDSFFGDNRKRRTKQVWVAKGEHDAFIRETRQKTSSVFERISGKNGSSSADPGLQGRWLQ